MRLGAKERAILEIVALAMARATDIRGHESRARFVAQRAVIARAADVGPACDGAFLAGRAAVAAHRALWEVRKEYTNRKLHNTTHNATQLQNTTTAGP